MQYNVPIDNEYSPTQNPCGCSLTVERERGITVKAQTASLFHTHKGQTYLLNLIDTPGHVDFGYEVSSSLAACQGTLLLVDATQGVQAQTLANFFLAFERDLTIIPVINKVDMDAADVDKVTAELESALDIDGEDVLLVSAKTGFGVNTVLEAVVERIAPPAVETGPLKALLFDSWYDHYRGVINMVQIRSGSLRVGDKITFASSGQSYDVIEVSLLCMFWYARFSNSSVRLVCVSVWVWVYVCRGVRRYCRVLTHKLDVHDTHELNVHDGMTLCNTT